MARIRTVKPEMALHEGLYDLEAETGLPIRFAWAMLPCHCDRRGRFQWRPRALGAQILPYDLIDFSRVLHALATRGFLVAYRVGDAWYGVIPTFERHQVINNRESESDLPALDDAEEFWPQESESSTRGARVDDATSSREVHAQAEGKGTEQGREEPPCGPPTGDDSSEAGSTDSSPTLGSQAKEVFDYWAQRLGKASSIKFTKDRKRKVEARLREGYTVEELKRAVDGILKSPHHMGENDQGIRYDDLELICRKGSKTDHFIELASAEIKKHPAADGESRPRASRQEL